MWLHAFWESSIHTKKKKRGGVIHSNSTRFVKLLLSICHHKSHFDLVFFGAALPAQFCLLILHRTPREFGGLSRTHRGKKRKQRPLFTERERRQSLRGLPLREEHETANKDIKHAVFASYCSQLRGHAPSTASFYRRGPGHRAGKAVAPGHTDSRLRSLGRLTPGTRPKPPSRPPQTVKDPLATQETQVRSLGREDPPEKGMEAHCSVLPWRTAGTEEPRGL